jgi:hypothetical protein
MAQPFLKKIMSQQTGSAHTYNYSVYSKLHNRFTKFANKLCLVAFTIYVLIDLQRPLLYTRENALQVTLFFYHFPPTDNSCLPVQVNPPAIRTCRFQLHPGKSTRAKITRFLHQATDLHIKKVQQNTTGSGSNLLEIFCLMLQLNSSKQSLTYHDSCWHVIILNLLTLISKLRTIVSHR